MRRAYLILIVLFVNFFNLCFAREIPNLVGPVMDEAHLLLPEEQRDLASFIRLYQQKTGHQIQVFIIDNLEGEVLENYSIQVVDKWKLGNKGKDDGILFLIVAKEHLMRLEVGRGLEGEIPDIVSFRILEEVKEFFRAQKFYPGVKIGLQRIVQVIDGDTSFLKEQGNVHHKRRGQSQEMNLPTAIVILVLLVILFFLRGFFPFIGTGGRGGGGGRYDDDNDSWRGGGGGFGGGGSSDRW